MPDHPLHHISSTRGQIRLSVKVDNIPLPIYAVKTESHQTEAWIACESGQTYTVHLDCQDYPRSPDYRQLYQSLNAELWLDGVMTEELTSVCTEEGRSKTMGRVVWKGTYVRKGYRRPFIFRSPNLIDPIDDLDPDLTQALGTIQVHIRRIQVSPPAPTQKPEKRDHFKRIWFDLDVPENAKKGVLSNLTELGKPERSLETLMYDIIAENEYDRKRPMTTLKLRYASREVLVAKGIIPGAKKDKSATEDRDEKHNIISSSETDSEDDPEEPVHLVIAPPLIPSPSSRRRKVNDNGNPMGRPSKRRRLYHASRAKTANQAGMNELRETARRLDEAFERDGGWVDLTGGESSDEV